MDFCLWHVYLVLMMFVSTSYSDTKIWQPNTDISQPGNWEEKFENERDCFGLSFARINTANVFVESLRVRELILPRFGVLEFQDDNSYIQIDDNAIGTDSLNCIELKSINQSRWGDFDNWKSVENQDNPAVPHSERLPCANDDIVFPHGINTSVFYDQYLTFRGKSFQFSENVYENSEFASFLDSSVGIEVFNFPRHTLIDDPLTECSIPNPEACEAVKHRELKCQNPVTPHGFCPEYPLCGGRILIQAGVSIDRIKRTLQIQGYESSTYVSKIIRDDEEKIQVVFTEKDFTGKSLEELQSFYSVLLNDKYFASKNPELLKSGFYYEKGLVLKSTLSVIFGTLFGVLLMFGLLFYAYGSKRELSLVGLRNRIVSARPLSTYLFAKYDNLEDQARIFEGQSMAGSLLTLDISNDTRKNISKDSPSTSTASLDTIIPKDEQVRKEKTVINSKECSHIELNDRKEPSIETVDDDDDDELLLKEL